MHDTLGSADVPIHGVLCFTQGGPPAPRGDQDPRAHPSVPQGAREAPQRFGPARIGRDRVARAAAGARLPACVVASPSPSGGQPCGSSLLGANMPQPRNSAGALAAAVERPNIFAVPVSQAAGGARDRRPDQVFDAAAACDPTRVALAGDSRTNSDLASGVRTRRLMDVGSIRAVLFIGVAVAIVAALAASVSPVRHERTEPRSPKVPSQRHRPPAHSKPLRPISRAPRPRPIRRGQARKPAVRPVRRRPRTARARGSPRRESSPPLRLGPCRRSVPSLIAPPGRGSLSACQLRRRPSSCDPGGSRAP